jgi:hypothetical protein
MWYRLDMLCRSVYKHFSNTTDAGSIVRREDINFILGYLWIEKERVEFVKFGLGN